MRSVRSIALLLALGGPPLAHRYMVRFRKRTPRDHFLEEIRALAPSQGFTVEEVSASAPEPDALQGERSPSGDMAPLRT